MPRSHTVPSDRNTFVGNKLSVDGYEVYSVSSKLDVSDEAQKPSPIVLLHGAIVSHLYWMPTADMLALSHDVYAIDFPGHGQSSKPLKTLGVVEQTEVVSKWLSLMNIPKATIAANSYGCQIAVELAIRHAEQVDQLVLTAPASDPSEPTIHQQAWRLYRDSFFENPTMGFVLIQDAINIGIRRGFETCQIMIDYDYLPRLPLVQHRCLVVRGDKDPVAPEPWVEKVVSLLPNAQLEVIPGGPHDINYSKGKELAKMINEFLLRG
jgi:pimeloyl-ACP methyl ester carboxylesterase